MSNPIEAKKLTEKFDAFLQNEYGISLTDVLSKERKNTQENEIFLPISVFATELSTLEATIKYLFEIKKFRFSKISKVLNRHPASITSAYKKTQKKFSNSFVSDQFPKTSVLIPLSIFSSRKLSPLESLVHYLHVSCKLKLSVVARLTKKDQRTIWTVQDRVKKKEKNGA